MDNEYFKQVSITIILVFLIVLSYLLLKPILISILSGIVLAFIFYPLYEWTNKKTKNKTLSASLMCLILILILILILWYLIPILVEESVKIYNSSQNTDFVGLLKTAFPSLFQTESLSNEIGAMINSFVSKGANALITSFSKVFLNLPTIFLYALVILFTFFFSLKDSDQVSDYIKSLLPFNKEIEEKLFKSSRDITKSVLYGRILLGIAQGLIVGIGFFLLKVPNATLLTVLSIFAGVFPIIGTVVVWLPMTIVFFINGNTFVAWGIVLFGLLATFFESIVQPIVLARMIKMNSSIALISMVGGIYVFGIIGVILGPLIIAYLLIILELYRKKKTPSILIEKN